MVGAEMTDAGAAVRWLRPVAASAVRAPVLCRDGLVVHPQRRLSELVAGRPPGITGHQWSTAIRAGFDFVVCDADTGQPVFAVEFAAPAAEAQARREERLRTAVCAAVGLPVLRISSPTLRARSHGRWIVEYVVDARRYAEGMSAWMEPVDGSHGVDGPPGFDEALVAPVAFRDIIGRLPDGRQGPVNDLGAVARSAAVDAYVARQLSDPIIRGLHLRWADGPAEGWSWVEVRPGWCLIERVQLWQHDFSCGVRPARLAEDLAAVAIGERFRDATFPVAELVTRAELGRAVAAVRARRGELVDGFDFDHLRFD